jgi:hypothetical protein
MIVTGILMNSVTCDWVDRLYRGVVLLKMWCGFYGTHINLISFTPIRKSMAFSAPLSIKLTNAQQHYV